MTESISTGDTTSGPMLLATDREARFRAIYDREFNFVWSAARYFGVPAAARDDVIQDVFLTAYRRFEQVHYQVSARAWLYGVTRRVASHWHRGVARRTRRIAALGDLTGHVGEAPHERHDAARQVERLLAGLPRGAREVWEMTELLGMNGPEIAAELELPLNTVYSRLRLARARLLELAAGPEPLVAEIAADRRRAEPPPEAAPRNWAAIVPLFGHGKLATVAAAWTAARTGVMTTLLVAGTAAVVVAAPRQAPGRGAPARSDLSHETDAKDRAHEPAAKDPAPSDLSEETAASNLSAEIAARDLSAETAARDLSAGTATGSDLSPGPAARARARDDLAREVGLLDRARARLDARDPTAAALLLDSHAREFPRGALVDAREAAAIELLCLQGRPADAAAAAARLTARLPDSVLTRRFARFACPDEPARTSPAEP
ncbi:RNA polymerase sigma factor [Nannocystis bainbridge]|uniref:Sigma-70 family RNA polymerase sigma factor n=1 Tax=Nannocystis bainbridge TaxID=2995303 RepID=A0ABT5EA54_9BACT|nr:sigma-70 family RNA polymerase sigma factor [Nannocystis bainbridge]MDC0722741.1 sigma-70 family RNA polymerase sigma factor [Nannocystis bainbridge]